MYKRGGIISCCVLQDLLGATSSHILGSGMKCNLVFAVVVLVSSSRVSLCSKLLGVRLSHFAFSPAGTSGNMAGAKTVGRLISIRKLRQPTSTARLEEPHRAEGSGLELQASSPRHHCTLWDRGLPDQDCSPCIPTCTLPSLFSSPPFERRALHPALHPWPCQQDLPSLSCLAQIVSH